MATMSNTFSPGGRELTAQASAPAAGPAPFGGLDAGLLSKLVALKLGGQEQPAQRAPQMAQQQPAYVPQLATAPAAQARPQQPVTRMRRVRSRTSIPSLLDQKGITYDDVQETLLPDGSWSGDAVYGRLAGNEAAARQRMDALDHPFGGSSRGGGDRGGDRPGSNTAIPWSQNNRNQDARGAGYGMDFGKKGTPTEGRG